MRRSQRPFRRAVSIRIGNLHTDTGTDVIITQGIGRAGRTVNHHTVAQPLVTESTKAISIRDTTGICSECLIFLRCTRDRGQTRRGVIDVGDRNAEHLASQTGCAILATIGKREGETVTEILGAVMVVGDEAGINICLGKGVVITQGCTAEIQGPVGRYGCDGIGYATANVIRVALVQHRRSDNGAGGTLGNRHARIGLDYRCIIDSP